MKYRTHLLISFSIVILSYNLFSQNGAIDFPALSAFYESTNGEEWKNKDNWLSERPLDEWFGVSTNEEGRVQALTLSANGLLGSIPPEIGDLDNLETIRFQGNSLSGNIPVELANCSSLKLLYLQNNQLTGEIPPELGSLINLEELALADNNLTGEIPPELGSLTNLNSLALYGNKKPIENSSDSTGLIGSIPPELGNLTKLEKLTLYTNKLTGEIPPELENLSNLTQLRLHVNELTGIIPPELGNLGNLERLWLSNNMLSGNIPPELGNLDDLMYISLHDNTLTGEIPFELGYLDSLNWLALQDNQLTGAIPTELGNLEKLKELKLANNQLSGRLPESLLELDSLSILQLHNNNLSGCYPDNICNYNGNLTIYENDQLPWNGDIDEVYLNYCNGVSQIGAPCGSTGNEFITETCECAEVTPETEVEEKGTNWILVPDCGCEAAVLDISDVIPPFYTNRGTTVYNRWGKIVYQSDAYQDDWGGTYMDTGKSLPEGTYFYFAISNSSSGDCEENICRTGLVTIIKSN